MDSPFGIRRHRRKPSINITSLIDVMFLLLIFLMVSTTFRHQLGIDVDLPEAGTASAQEMRPHEIVVTRNGEYYFGSSGWMKRGSVRQSSRRSNPSRRRRWYCGQMSRRTSEK